MVASETVAVGSVEDLRTSTPTAVQVDGRSVGLFFHEDRFFATALRCPHMGFPLTDGSVEDGLLTCPWHHARFELECGDTLDPFADDVRTFPVTVDDGTVYVSRTPAQERDPIDHWHRRLEHGLREALSLIIAKAAIGLADEGVEPALVNRPTTRFGVRYRAEGWGPGLTTLGAMASLSDHLADADRPRAWYVGARAVADDCAGEPPFFPQDPLSNDDLSPTRLRSWFRDTVEVRDADGAERVLRAAIAADFPPGDVAAMIVTAATDHRYLDTGHRIDFVNKAFEVLDRIGWDHADEVLPSLVPGLTAAGRAEEEATWRQPIDLVALLEAAFDALPGAVPSNHHGWVEPAAFTDRLLADDPQSILEAVTAAIDDGAGTLPLARAVAGAGAIRLARFGTANEFRDWNTVHHTYTYANAVCGLAERTTTTALYKAILDGAMSVYLDRFLNVPPTPLPDPDGSGDPGSILASLADTFDTESEDAVDRAGERTAAFLAAGGSPSTLIERLAGVLLREDVGFHPRQNLEAAVTMFEREREHDPDRARIHLIAGARYLAAHTPTRRSGEQTFHIAERLHRGERIHESVPR